MGMRTVFWIRTLCFIEYESKRLIQLNSRGMGTLRFIDSLSCSSSTVCPGSLWIFPSVSCRPHCKHQNELLGLVRWSSGYGRYMGPLNTLTRDTSSWFVWKHRDIPNKNPPSRHEMFCVVSGEPSLMAYLPTPTSLHEILKCDNESLSFNLMICS